MNYHVQFRKDISDVQVPDFIAPMRVSRWLTWSQVGNLVTFEGVTANRKEANVDISIVSEGIVHVRARFRNSQPAKVPFELIKQDWSQPPVDVVERQKTICIKSKSVSVCVKKDPWCIAVSNKAGECVFKECSNDGSMNGYMDAPSLGRMSDGKNRWVFDNVCVQSDESFFGLGERFDSLNKRGRRIVTYTLAGLGSLPPISYKPVPFIMSSRGYGILVATTKPVTFDVASRSYAAMSFGHAGDELDYYIIVGETPTHILNGYYEITGKPNVPPKWSFGYVQSSAKLRTVDGARHCGYMTQQEVLDIAKRLRAEKIPCDTITLDIAWSGNYDPTCEKVYDWAFCKSRFPNPKKMIKTLRDMGFKLCVTQWPYMKKCFPDYKELSKKGLIVKNKNGDEYFYKWGDTVIDLTNPKAVEWLMRKNTALCKMGVAALMADFAEMAPVDGVYHNGLSGLENHNLYPLIYQKALYKVLQKYGSAGPLWARAGYIGSHLTPGHWAGDQSFSFASLAAVLRAGLNFSLSGGVIWGFDVGAFFNEGADTKEAEELLLRYVQLGTFSPFMRCHGSGKTEPWLWSENVQTIFKKYANLRSRLIPYIYSCARESRVTGKPIMRAMFLEFPDDLTAWGIESQFMLGPALLVAPVCEPVNRKDVYLPAGKWKCFWTGKIYKGSAWHRIKAPAHTIPVFQRENTILPLGPVKQFQEEKSSTKIQWNCFVTSKAEYRFFSDKSSTLVTAVEKNGQCKIRVRKHE